MFCVVLGVAFKLCALSMKGLCIGKDMFGRMSNLFNTTMYLGSKCLVSC